MKHYTLSFGQSICYKHESPERTAYRQAGTGAMDFDLYFQVWTNRKAMAKSVRMQEKTFTPNSRKWVPVIKLTDGEGY